MRIAWILTCIMALCNPLQAFVLKPITMEFAPVGEDATKSFVVSNDSNQAIAVLVTIATRDVAEDGTESNEELNEAFMVYPSQLVLMPGEQQTLRVTWLGDPSPSVEKAYRMIAEQLPIQLSEKEIEEGHKGGLKLMFRFVAALYVTPNKAAPELSLKSGELIRNQEGPKLVVAVENVGSAHQVVRRFSIDVVSKLDPKKRVTLNEESFSALKGVNMLAGLRRVFALPWPEGLPEGPVEITAFFQ